jgi:hypothetical protein
MKWDLDLWYELWDRAGSQGLDNWYDPRGEVCEGTDTGRTSEAALEKGEGEPLGGT